jgi:hypothetical protein
MRILRVVGSLAFLWLASRAGAQVELGDTTHVLTIEGKVASDQAAAQKSGYTAVSVGFDRQSPNKLRWIGVVRTESEDGDAVLGHDLLVRTQGFTPNIMAVGKTQRLSQLENAPAGSRVVLQGILDEGSRELLLGLVKVTPPGGGH